MRTLGVPLAAQRDENAVQMVSAWIAEKGLHCALNVGMWQENGKPEGLYWGILLADVIRHVANAMRDEYGLEPDKTIEAITNAIREELDEPTSKVTGGFHPGHS